MRSVKLFVLFLFMLGVSCSDNPSIKLGFDNNFGQNDSARKAFVAPTDAIEFNLSEIERVNFLKIITDSTTFYTDLKIDKNGNTIVAASQLESYDDYRLMQFSSGEYLIFFGEGSSSNPHSMKPCHALKLVVRENR